MVRYVLEDNGAFTVGDYNRAAPFASFFPGIGGELGIPMWVFYVNRAQCVCSAGIVDKDCAVLEFHSANRAFEIVGLEGFRTFIKDVRESESVWEPFAPGRGEGVLQRMVIRPHELEIAEEDEREELVTRVTWFTVAEEDYPGLVRVVEVKNTGGKERVLEILDGAAVVVPYGVDNRNIKFMRRLVEAFVEVVDFGEGCAPVFKCRVKQEDSPEVQRVEGGHFYFGWNDGGKALRVVVDPEAVFGSRLDLVWPERFAERRFFVCPRRVGLENKMPCAMTVQRVRLERDGSVRWFSILGHCGDSSELRRIRLRARRWDYVEDLRERNRRTVYEVMDRNWILSSRQELNLYARQNFLDNVLRGGVPVTLEAGDGHKTVLHLYSRKHGDLERDYNDFRLTPTPFSQGNGNYRDVNQNRRSDLFFNPDLGAANVRHFYNLIQLDGFNPLIIRPTSFQVSDRQRLSRVLNSWLPPPVVPHVESFVEKRFLPGDLIALIRSMGKKRIRDERGFLAEVLACCERYEESDYGHGFWTDHWTYNLDLLENYLAVYPEKLRSILLEDQSFTFFNNPYRVQPRREKYVIWNGHPMQLGAVVWDDEKAAQISKHSDFPYEVRMQWGDGPVYRTTLLTKLLCLLVNKTASLDPSGIGVEMEADKPNWYDALNGLPGLFGSSICEAIEIKRHIDFLVSALEQLGVRNSETFSTYVELRTFMAELTALLRSHLRANADGIDDFEFWDRANTAKEHYREQTRLGISGEETAVSFGELREFLALAREKVDRGIRKAWDRKAGLPRTYFVHEVVDYEEETIQQGGRSVVRRNSRGMVCFRPLKFRRRALPLFLEGPVHYLRAERNPRLTKKIYEAVRRSGLYDEKLKMYKVNECLLSEPLEIGRARTFARGWLENESIWLHMEYKYMLELLRCGAVQEFYNDWENVLVPFMKPQVYGRSILENSSFIASSANPDRKIHGRGFVARLSGSTAEFIHMIMLMAVGEKPFRYEAGELVFAPQPRLLGKLFTRQRQKVQLYIQGRLVEEEIPPRSFACLFLGKVLLCYRNPSGRNTFGAGAVKPVRLVMEMTDGERREVQGEMLRGSDAEALRSGKVRKLEIILG